MATIVLVVGTTATLTDGDIVIRDRLVAAGHTVVLRNDTDAEYSGTYDGVYIADSSSGGDVGSKYDTVAKPGITAENASWRLGTYLGAISGTQWTVENVEGNGGITGTVTVYNSTQSQQGIDTDTLPAGAIVVARLAGDADHGTYVLYPAGISLTSGTAPAKRVFFRMGDAQTADANATGRALLDAAIGWAFGPAAPIEKSGSDSGTGADSGSVSATVDGADAATGTESGHIALEGGDSGVGAEEGYSGEERLGGDVAAGAETGDSAATLTPPGDTATGTELGDTAATITTDADTATGSEGGHIAIPGEDTATGADWHEAPTQVTVSTGETATGAEGGYVETLYGDLIVSLYLVDPDSGELTAVPDYESLDISRERNSKGAIRLQYPVNGQAFELLRDTVEDGRDVEFELWTNGTPIGALRGYIQEGQGDDVVADDNGEDGSWQFAGSFLELRTDETVVFPQSRGSQVVNPDTGELEWTNPRRELIVNADTPGELMSLLLQQAQARGALDDIERDFTTTHDSNGVAWAGQLTAKFSPGVTYTQILDKLVDLHLAEWAIVWDSQNQRRILKLWNAEGRGADLTLGPRPVTLRRGRNLLDAPHQWSVRDSATTLLAAGAEGIYRDTTDATALARRDRRIEAYASLQNADNEDAVLAFAQAELATLSPGFLSISHGIGMLPGEPRPVIAFDIGDWVLSFTGTQGKKLRVVQWTLSIDNERSLAGTVTLNDTVQDAIERLQERLNAISSGEAVVGTSEPGGSNEPDRTPPAAPEGVVASSIAYQDPQHGPGQTLAMVSVGWLPVTTNADGADNPLVQAAVYIRDKLEDEQANPEVPDPDQEDGGPNYDPIQEDWTWKNCPQVVRDFNDPLLELYEDDGSPADQIAWLTAYIAEASQTPTAADDIAGYRVRYSYLGLEQVGGIPSSDPFPEDERVYYEATPPSGTSSTNYDFGGIEGGSRLRIEVCAFDRSGNQGAWTSISHDCAEDATAPPVPSAPVGLKTWFRTLDIPWDGLGAEGEPMPIDFSHVRVWVGQGADLTLPANPEPTTFSPTETAPQWVANLYAGGTWNVPDLPIGVGYYARLQAVDYSGNASAGSVVVGPVTAERLVSDDLIDDIIDANKLGPNSVENQHVVNGAITSAKIVDANIIRAKIADLAVNDAKIESVKAGSIITGTLLATVTVSGSLWTSTDPNATRLGFSAAGLQLYRTNAPSAGSTLIGEWRTSDGSMLVTGTYRSALSGERIHIDPDGSLRFYPASGTNYSRIMNESNDIVWRGPLNASGYSGRVNVNILGVGLNFSKEENLLKTINSEIVLFDRRMRQTAPFIQLQADERFSVPGGGDHRVQFSRIQSDGDEDAHLSFMATPSAHPTLVAGAGAALIWANPAQLQCKMYDSGNFGDWVNIHAAGYPGPSSRDVKRDIEDARAILDPLRTIRNARAVKYRYIGNSPISDIMKFGVIADELPEELVLKYPGDPQVYVDYASLTGVLWGAFGQVLDQQIVSTSGTCVLLRSQLGPGGIFAPGATAEVEVTWESEPPAAPTGGFVQMHSSFVWAGKVTAWIKTGSVTSAGCVVVFKNISNSNVVVNETNDNLRVSATAIGLGLYTPPYVPPEEQ